MYYVPTDASGLVVQSIEDEYPIIFAGNHTTTGFDCKEFLRCKNTNVPEQCHLMYAAHRDWNASLWLIMKIEVMEKWNMERNDDDKIVHNNRSKISQTTS